VRASTPVRTSTHPLDTIAFFRRWPCSPWRDLLYTGIWNSMIALFLAVVGRMVHQDGSFLVDLYRTFVVSNVVGYLIHFALMGSNWLLRGWPSRLSGAPRLLYHVGLIGLCVVLGIALGTAFLKGVNPMLYLGRMAGLTPLVPFAVVVGVFMFVILAAGERRVAADLAAARQAEQFASAAQLLAEARLRALQAQIEPHFLYNTLANVVGLIDTQPARARHMLERFIDYLRASLAASRADSATLGAELDMARAYLDVLAVRMGERLRYRFDVDDALRALPITPMLLQPVIENAVAHGLEPKVEGGEIVLRASFQDGQLNIEISDSGAGLSNAAPKPGGGVGLSNLRARLRSIYGPSAQVQLLENQPSGITVRLVLPLKEKTTSTTPVP
jgi:hypothetical protein